MTGRRWVRAERLPAYALAGLVMWLVQPLYLVVELLAVSAVRVSYSLAHNTISDLGATTCTDIAYPSGPVAVCSPLHQLVNGSFVLSGVLLAVGAVLLRPLLPTGSPTIWAVGTWIVAGASSIATGLVPLDVDPVLHYAVSAPAFLAQPAALLLTGAAMRHQHPRTGWCGIAVGAVSLLVGVFFTVRLDSAFGGLLERSVLWPVSVWSSVAAIALWRATRGSAAPGSTGQPAS